MMRVMITLTLLLILKKMNDGHVIKTESFELFERAQPLVCFYFYRPCFESIALPAGHWYMKNNVCSILLPCVCTRKFIHIGKIAPREEMDVSPTTGAEDWT